MTMATKRTTEEKVEAALVALGEHDNRIDAAEQLAAAAEKTAKAAAGLAGQTAAALKRHAELCAQTQAADDEGDELLARPVDLLTGSADYERQRSALVELDAWVREVWIRYPDHGLTECWLWHPWAVAELWHLFQVWERAYGVAAAEGGDRAVLDWHVRYRKPLADEIGRGLTDCALDRHADPQWYDPPATHGQDSIEALAAWYTDDTNGASAPPPPSATELGLAVQRVKRRDELTSTRTAGKVPRR
jgi:hypothetical protein